MRFRIFLFLGCLFLFFSCGKIISSKTTKVYTKSNKQVSYGTSFKTDSLNTVLYIAKKRINDSIPIFVSSKKEAFKSRYILNKKFNTNVLFGILFYGIPIIGDFLMGSVMDYPSYIFIDSDKNRMETYNFLPKRNLLQLTFGTGFGEKSFKGKYGKDSKPSLFPIRLGAEYYYSDYRYIGLNNNFQLGINFFQNSTFFQNQLSLTHNHEIDRFAIGYGTHFSYVYFKARHNHDYDSSFKERQMILGAVFPVSYRITNRFRVGLEYAPNLFYIDEGFKFRFASNTLFTLGWTLPIKER